MAKKDYIPVQEGTLNTWLSNLIAKIDTHAPQLGLTAAEITAIKQAGQKLIDEIISTRKLKRDYKSQLEKKNKQKAGSLGLIRNAVKRMKLHKNYTEGMGKNMNVEGPEAADDFKDFKPRLRIDLAVGGYIRIRYFKKGVDGIHIYTRLRGKKEWQLLAADLHSPYIDKRPLAVPGVPEVREYYAVAFIKDKEVGQKSNISIIAFSGK